MHVLSALFVAIDGEYLQREDVLRRGAHVDKAALLAGLAQGDAEKVGIAIRVAAQPRPRAVDVVPCHQGAVAAGVDDPSRGRHVEKRAGAQEDVFMRSHGGEHRLPVAFFLFVEGPVGLKGAAYLHCHPPRRAPCSAGIR